MVLCESAAVQHCRMRYQPGAAAAECFRGRLAQQGHAARMGIARCGRGKGIFSLPWSGDMETLEGLLKLEVHATQLERDMMGHPRYAEVEGDWPHQAEAGQPA